MYLTTLPAIINFNLHNMDRYKTPFDDDDSPIQQSQPKIEGSDEMPDVGPTKNEDKTFKESMLLSILGEEGPEIVPRKPLEVSDMFEEVLTEQAFTHGPIEPKFGVTDTEIQPQIPVEPAEIVSYESKPIAEIHIEQRLHENTDFGSDQEGIPHKDTQPDKRDIPNKAEDSASESEKDHSKHDDSKIGHANIIAEQKEVSFLGEKCDEFDKHDIEDDQCELSQIGLNSPNQSNTTSLYKSPVFQELGLGSLPIQQVHELRPDLSEDEIDQSEKSSGNLDPEIPKDTEKVEGNLSNQGTDKNVINESNSRLEKEVHKIEDLVG
jgi:hypothetical protein